ncbi:hypothetical protein SAMN04489864_10985 [Pedobacter insulae]|uniref:Uncharacterized protein n=1 Tax=Pedobacter insulae TaxID=414048 RepID=A0A1I2ZA89_9SPHI|nr:hypothetical protein SAMN04489864_10985 [Pedobacter insulae]
MIKYGIGLVYQDRHTKGLNLEDDVIKRRLHGYTD